MNPDRNRLKSGARRTGFRTFFSIRSRCAVLLGRHFCTNFCSIAPVQHLSGEWLSGIPASRVGVCCSRGNPRHQNSNHPQHHLLSTWTTPTSHNVARTWSATLGTVRISELPLAKSSQGMNSLYKITTIRQSNHLHGWILLPEYPDQNIRDAAPTLRPSPGLLCRRSGYE